MNQKVQCIDDNFKPEGIKDSNWVKKGQVYTVKKVLNMAMYGNALAFQLKEIEPDPPFVAYMAHRFIKVELN